MRFTNILLTIVGAASFSFASPLPTATIVQRDLSSNLASAEATISSLAAALPSIIARVQSDPELKLDPVGEYNIPVEASAAFTTAINGIESLPSLPSSNDIPASVLNSYGPLVRLFTESFFYSLIDLKVLYGDTLASSIPGSYEAADNLDRNTYQLVGSLDAQFIGFSTELSNAVGSDTALGQAFTAIGWDLFPLLFDHIGGFGKRN